jgi:hypothetical protein
MLDPITCVLVIDNLGDHVWIPIAEWQTNPLCVLLPVEDVREPVIKEKDDYWFIGTVKSNIPKKEYVVNGGRQYGKSMTSDQIYLQMVKEQIEMKRKRDDWLKERGK